jgi:DNA invertase Pin-like site-specific DNA recombinase
VVRKKRPRSGDDDFENVEALDAESLALQIAELANALEAFAEEQQSKSRHPLTLEGLKAARDKTAKAAQERIRLTVLNFKSTGQLITIAGIARESNTSRTTVRKYKHILS